jgi:large-conductance mechanosensitive channel
MVKKSKEKFTTGTFITRLRNFLIEKDLIYIMIAVYVGTVLQKFLETFTKSIIMPILTLITPEWFEKREKDFKDTLETLGFVNMKELISQTFNLIIAISISYILIRFVLGLNNDV